MSETKQDEKVEKFTPIEYDREQYEKMVRRPVELNTTRQNG